MPELPPSPYPASGHPDEPLAPPTKTPSHLRSWLPLVLVTAIIAGGMGALGTFLITRPGTTGHDDVAIACTAVDRIGFPPDKSAFRMDEPLLHQLNGLAGFATAAAVGNDSNATLEEAAGRLRAGLQRADLDMINDALEQISTTCGDIGR